MAERLRPAQESFGFALYPDDGSFATVANVFAHDAEQLAGRRGMRQGVILGHLMAHEVGHLLVGAGSHSAVGIMHVPWHLKELEIIRQGAMTFTPKEAERMRTNIRVRMAGRKRRRRRSFCVVYPRGTESTASNDLSTGRRMAYRGLIGRGGLLPHGIASHFRCCTPRYFPRRESVLHSTPSRLETRVCDRADLFG